MKTTRLWLASVCVSLLAGCMGSTNEPVGLTYFAVVNNSDRALIVTYQAHPSATLREFADRIEPEQTVDLLSANRGFGSSPRPDEVLTQFRVLRATDSHVVVDLAPVESTDWVESEEEDEELSRYSTRYTLTVSQDLVDSAVAP